LRAETINNLNQEGIKMKALTKKVLVILIVLAVTVTLAYAGMKSENMVSWDEVFNHPALDALTIAYNAAF
jgi:Tfp pilus assembly protein PilO